MKFGAVAVVYLGLAAHSVPVLATPVQGEPSVTMRERQAREAMERGVALYGRGEPEAALGQYELAKTFAPLANLPYRYAAEALIALRRYREAVAELEGYLAKNPAVSDRDEVAERIRTLKREHFAGHVRFQTQMPTPNLKVIVDETVIALNETIELRPGIHSLVVSGPGIVHEERTFEVIGDTQQTKVLSPSLTSPPSIQAKPLPPILPIKTGWPTLGWIGLGAAGVTLATSLVLDLTYLKNASDAYDNAIGYQVSEKRDAAIVARTVVVAGYGLGLTFAVGATLVLLLAPSTRGRDAALGLIRF